MRALSLDLRQRIVAARDDGQTQSQIAQRFAVSQPTVSRILTQWDQHQNLTPKPKSGRPARISPEQMPQLEALVASRTDWMISTLAAAWHQHSGETIGLSTLHRVLHKQRFSYKKRAASPPSATPTNGKPSERP
jgi:transposase